MIVAFSVVSLLAIIFLLGFKLIKQLNESNININCEKAIEKKIRLEENFNRQES